MERGGGRGSRVHSRVSSDGVITSSPGRIPAFCAGLPLNGATTISFPSALATSIPTPSRCPSVDIRKVSKSLCLRVG